MFVKKDTTTVPPLQAQFREYDQELEVLYARRSAIDALIQSLQDYDRYRAPQAESGDRKSA